MTKKFFLRGLAVMVSLFLVLLALRLAYGYMAYSGTEGTVSITNSSIANGYAVIDNNGFELSRKNYASQKSKPTAQAFPGSGEQKYEKVGSVVSQSLDFKKDEQAIRDLVANYAALIQFEQSQGLAGNRILNVGIGVAPEKFDAFVVDCRKVGRLLSIRIDKTDKTNEYKDLQAKRASLAKTRDALLGLKGRGGKIEELINLENRILDVETQIQSLGVRLGEFDAENEFCTVKLSLKESVEAQGVPFSQRLIVAVEWTASVYLSLAAALFFGSLFLWLFLPLLDRIVEFLKKWQVRV